MQDFIFGTLSTDDLKLFHHRVARNGVHHAHVLNPLDPEVEKPVRISVRVGPDVRVDRIACYYTLDGSIPAGELGESYHGYVQPLERVRIEWDNFTWGFISYWEATLPPQPQGKVVRYRIGAWAERSKHPTRKKEIFCDWPDIKSSLEEAARAFFHKEPPSATTLGDSARGVTFNYHVDRLKPPQWARESVIYQIFVDRFFPGKGRDWEQTDDLKGFIGGTLWGVAEKLDYVAELGATCVWLSPIFPSPTSHGYDAMDYEQVAPRLGGDEALKTLVGEAHRRGIRVILDLVCNHLSDRHPIFRDALSSQASPYRDWFFFDDSRAGYRMYFGVPSMPQINLANPATQRWMIEIAQYWLREFDVDGFRLDHANGPGPSFWSDFWAECKNVKPEAFCFGEIVEEPSAIRRYYGRMDGALDFNLADAFRRTFAYRTLDEDDLHQFLDHHLAYFNYKNFLMLTFLDNHDMDRFHFIAGDDKNLLRKAAEIQMRLPGPPIIYYGTEAGMSQILSKSSEVGLEASRMPMIWGEDQDTELFGFYKTLIRERFDKKPWIR
jgi:1,4-alpha-glucan branching enzyme